ncbi:MAG: alpha/beta hydrolase, partial [Pseudomonadota bacterium]
MLILRIAVLAFLLPLCAICPLPEVAVAEGDVPKCILNLQNRELKIFKVPGTHHQIHYDVPIGLGRNDPIVVYLGGFGLGFNNSRILAGQSHEYGYNVVRVNMIGIGETLKSEIERGKFDPDQDKINRMVQARAVLKLIKSISDRPVAVMGLSYGGTIAAEASKGYLSESRSCPSVRAGFRGL